MADDKVEGVTTSETASFVAQRRAVTQTPGQDEALAAAAAGKIAPETKTDPDAGTKAVMEKLSAMEGKIEKQTGFIEDLKKDNYKLRQRLRNTKETEEDDSDETEEQKPEEVQLEKMFEKLEGRLMKKLAPMVTTVRKLDFGSQIMAIASGNQDVNDAILSLPPEIQASLADRVERLAEGMKEEGGDPVEATVNAIFFLAHRHGRKPAAEGVTLPDTMGRPSMEAESEDRKINRALFGESFVPRGRPRV